MSELRQDATSGDWVIVAPGRADRPRTNRMREVAALPLAAAVDRTCPFCAGHEHMLAGVIAEIPGDAPPGWRVRVVPNRYPAVLVEDGARPPVAPPSVAIPALGCHEVIVETPRHDADLATLPPGDVAAVVQCYQDRFVALAARPGIASVTLFRNHGPGGGASLAHPHSQILATALPSPRLARAIAWAGVRHAETGQCPTCAEIARETADGRRIVEATEHFLVIVPFAATSPFEQWVVPRRHQASFAQLAALERTDFAAALQRAVRRLRSGLGDPPYNYAIDSALPTDAGGPFVHWRLRIVPGLVTPGGFEMGSGLPINPSCPEDDARVLREAALAENAPP
ncbi:MAG: galactose-1-phosphate uridylyltransferase [Alphaproteobacteria bacterium]|nr:galactose-1-phosphate uridylyltransferase [Alphaproteobacteria bacterium]